jgi:hypothetical protein
MVSTALHLNISGDARIAAHGCRIQDTLFEPVFSVAILTNYIKVRRRDAIVVTTENHPCGSIGLTFSSRAGAVISDDTGLCHEDRAIGVLQLNPIALSLRYVRICLPYLRYCASVPKRPVWPRNYRISLSKEPRYHIHVGLFVIHHKFASCLSHVFKTTFVD